MLKGGRKPEAGPGTFGPINTCMMKLPLHLLPGLAALFLHVTLWSQGASIRTDGLPAHPSAILDVQSDNQGILIPRMTTAQRLAIPDPADGLIVFDTQTRTIWTHNSAVWTNLGTPNRIADADGDTQIRVEKSPDEDAIRMDLAGTEAMLIRTNAHGSVSVELPHPAQNTLIGQEAGLSVQPAIGVSGDGLTAVGYRAGYANTLGQYNTLLGNQAGRSNTTGDRNTATGYQSLYANTLGHDNTAAGYQSLYTNTTGDGNTAIGRRALYTNASGDGNTALGMFSMHGNSMGNENTAVGMESLYGNVSGTRNTASGYRAMYFNTEGFQNTASGGYALYANDDGIQNTAMGYEALYAATTNNNTAVGYQALRHNTTGTPNAAMGYQALHFNSTGHSNNALGYRALYNNGTGFGNQALGNEALRTNTTGNWNTATGHWALYDNVTQAGNTAFGAFAGNQNTFSYSTYIGFDAYPSANGLTNTTGVGRDARPTGSNQMRFGNASVSSIGGYEDWSNLSDGRFKTAVREDVAGLEFIRDLRPVTYQLDVEKLVNALGEDIGRDADGNLIPVAPDAETLEGRTAKAATRYSGFIAQEVEAAATARGYIFSGVDLPDAADDFYGLRYGTFVVPLVKAAQELADMADEQQARIAALEMQNQALMAREALLFDQMTALLTRLDDIEMKTRKPQGEDK